MVDSAGNTIEAVGVPLTGFLAYAPEDTEIPSPSEGASTSLTLDNAFKKVGLLKEDGGFEWEQEPDGDPIVFWQDGYTIPTGMADVTLTFIAAEHSEVTRVLSTGKEPDENGYLTVDGGGSGTKYVFFSEEVYANGAIRRRVAKGRVQSAKLEQSERGEVHGIEFEIEITRSDEFDGDHYGEWYLDAS